MQFSTGSHRSVLPMLAVAFALSLPACSMFGGGSEPDFSAAMAEVNAATPAGATEPVGLATLPGAQPGAPATAAAAQQATPAAAGATPGQILDVRRYIGSDYCPEIRIRPGTEVVRVYERGHEGETGHVVWQASVGKTARECLYDQAGNLTLRVGVSGRVIAGPRGGGQTVTVPLRIAVVKHKEAVLANEFYPLSVVIPPTAPVVFNEVREVTVPSPRDNRDYIVYIGYDEKGENLLDPAAAVIAAVPPAPEPAPDIFEDVELEEPEPAPVRAEPPPKPAGPRMLPTPTDGFVLPR